MRTAFLRSKSSHYPTSVSSKADTNGILGMQSKLTPAKPTLAAGKLPARKSEVGPFFKFIFGDKSHFLQDKTQKCHPNSCHGSENTKSKPEKPQNQSHIMDPNPTPTRSNCFPQQQQKKMNAAQRCEKSCGHSKPSRKFLRRNESDWINTLTIS